MTIGTSQPSVTVVIPSFENNDTLPAALRSLASQTVTHKTIIIDDGSTKPVADCVDTGVAVVLRQDNRGVGSARNLGIQQADTEFVAFLDADDVWDPNYLERQLAYLAGLRGLAGVICAPHPPHGEDLVGARQVEFRSTLISLRGGPGTSAWVFRRSALTAVDGFDTAFRRMQDYELLIRMCGQGYGVLRHDESLYRYLPSISRGNRYSLHHQRALERFAERYGSLAVFPWLEHRLSSDDRRRVRSLMYSRAMNVAAARNDQEEVKRLARLGAPDAEMLPPSRRLMIAAAAKATRGYVAAMHRRT